MMPETHSDDLHPQNFELQHRSEAVPRNTLPR